MLANSVKNQTKQIFKNIEILFENIQENEFDTIKGGFKTWKHIYHLIHSMDKNFIDPSNYEEPIFHIIEPNLALAIGKGSGTSVFTGITVLLMRDEGKYFYDDEEIKLPSKPNQAGLYQYESKSGRKTVPVISIK